MVESEIAPNPVMYFVVMSSRTAFFKLEDIFPECFLYRESSPQIEPLICLREDNSCHVGRNCMNALVGRIRMLFDQVLPNANLVVLYYKKRNLPGIGAGVFWRDFRTPRTITVNPYAWSKIKQRGELFEFHPDSGFFLTGKSAPPEKAETSPSI
jgi:hypothetical protein